MSNALRTAALMGALTGLLVGLGYLVGGSGLALVALIFAAVMNFFSYWFSDKLALRMAGAHEVSEYEARRLHAIVDDVAERAGIPKPRVYIVETESPNAFATGRNQNHAVVTVTTGILRILNERELRAVIAHEVGHVKNRDILTTSMAATLAGAISYIQTMLMWGSLLGSNRNREGGNILIAFLASIVAAFAATLIRLGISRTREYQADRSGAEYVGDPEALASALARLENGVQMVPMRQTPGSQATAPLYIVHPFREGGFLSGLFSTHPPTEERIRRLEAMAMSRAA